MLNAVEGSNVNLINVLGYDVLPRVAQVGK